MIKIFTLKGEPIEAFDASLDWQLQTPIGHILIESASGTRQLEGEMWMSLLNGCCAETLPLWTGRIPSCRGCGEYLPSSYDQRIFRWDWDKITWESEGEFLDALAPKVTSLDAFETIMTLDDIYKFCQVFFEPIVALAKERKCPSSKLKTSPSQ